MLMLLLSGAAGAADSATATKHDESRALPRAPSREASPRKVQWAPTGNTSALHARAAFEEESGEAARPYAREGREVAAESFYQRWYDSSSGRFLSRDPVGASNYLATPNGLGPWAYAAGNPTRFVDADGRDYDYLFEALEADRASKEGKDDEFLARQQQRSVATGTGFGVGLCVFAPEACAPLMKFGFGAYTGVWLLGVQGHTPEGGHVEAMPDPVTTMADGVFGSAYRCGDRWQAGDCALTVANLLMLGRAGMMTPTARTMALSAYLKTAPLELEAPEVLAMRAFSRGTTVPFETGPLASPAPGTYSSLAGPTAGFKQMTDFERWLATRPTPLPVKAPHFEPPPSAYEVYFGQRRVAPNFRAGESSAPDYIYGRSIDHVAQDLRQGVLAPDQIRIEAFMYQGKLVTTNNRGLAALSKAGLRPTNVVVRQPTPAELARLREPGLFKGQTLPGASIAVTPGQRDLSILEIIALPE
jgi:RHS repeat-associated protein